MVKKYQAKPVVVEAIQWTGNNYAEVFDFMQGNFHSYTRGNLIIHTLKGDMRATESDYIIKGLLGEFYPCNARAFERKYEEVL